MPAKLLTKQAIYRQYQVEMAALVEEVRCGLSAEDRAKRLREIHEVYSKQKEVE